MALETGHAWTPVFVKATRSTQERAETRAMLRNMALFLSAPFVGLLYAILLPFVGLGMLAWFAGRALFESAKVRETLGAGKKVLAIGAAPFAALVCVIALPFAGLGMLAWFAVKAAMAAPAM
jgi:hypothetical protein